MEQSQSIAKLAEALAKVQAELKPAQRDSENPFYKSSYADLAAVSKSTFPVLAKHGLSVSQIAEGEGAVTTILMHTSGEWLRGTLTLKPVKADPQGQGSAITYARRYALASIVGLATEDDDGNAATHTKETPAKKDKSTVEDMPPLSPELRIFLDETFEAISHSTSIDGLKAVKKTLDEKKASGFLPEFNFESLRKQLNNKAKTLEEKKA